MEGIPGETIVKTAGEIEQADEYALIFARGQEN
jgi:hypothetical protein